jgi:transposase
MSTYSKEELEELLNNKNVKRASAKSISYTAQFKQSAVLNYYKGGMSPQEIFTAAGFNLTVIGRKKPKSLLRDWKGVYNSKGTLGLSQENRGRSGGRKPKTIEPEDPEYLKAKIAYLEAENNFLKKLKTKINP